MWLNLWIVCAFVVCASTQDMSRFVPEKASILVVTSPLKSVRHLDEGFPLREIQSDQPNSDMILVLNSKTHIITYNGSPNAEDMSQSTLNLQPLTADKAKTMVGAHEEVFIHLLRKPQVIHRTWEEAMNLGLSLTNEELHEAHSKPQETVHMYFTGKVILLDVVVQTVEKHPLMEKIKALFSTESNIGMHNIEAMMPAIEKLIMIYGSVNSAHMPTLNEAIENLYIIIKLDGLRDDHPFLKEFKKILMEIGHVEAKDVESLSNSFRNEIVGSIFLRTEVHIKPTILLLVAEMGHKRSKFDTCFNTEAVSKALCAQLTNFFILKPIPSVPHYCGLRDLEETRVKIELWVDPHIDRVDGIEQLIEESLKDFVPPSTQFDYWLKPNQDVKLMSLSNDVPDRS